MSFNKKELKKIKQEKEIWEKEYKKLPKRDVKFTTVSGMDVPPLVTPADLDDFNYISDLGFPGSYPFTRGIYSTMHQGRLWTMRQFAGFGAPEDTNQRFKFL